MAPWITIFLAALLGFVWKGAFGALAGLLFGWVIGLLFGALAFATRGGVVPRRARRDTAQRFLESHRAQAEAAFGGLDEAGQLRAIEHAIEKVFRRSMDDNPSPTERALERDSVQGAVVALADEADTPAARDFWMTLGTMIDLTMYP